MAKLSKEEKAWRKAAKGFIKETNRITKAEKAHKAYKGKGTLRHYEKMEKAARNLHRKSK